MQLILDTHDLMIRVRNRSFLVGSKTETRLISPSRLTSIACLARTTWTSAALLLAVENGIEVLFLEGGDKPSARLSATDFANIGTVRRAQALFAMSELSPRYVADLFLLKTAGQIAVLEHILLKNTENLTKKATESTIAQIKNLSKNFHKTAETAADADVWSALMGLEGSIARLYWPIFGASLPTGFRFEKRSRRPARDGANALLNYLYGMLYQAVEGAILAVGLDPSMGILHADEYAEPTLAFDLIEPFRQVADAVLVDILVAGLIQSHHFEPTDAGILITKEGRRLLISAMNERLHSTRIMWRGTETTWKIHIHQFAGELVLQLKKYWEHADFSQLRHRKRPSADADGQ